LPPIGGAPRLNHNGVPVGKILIVSSHYSLPEILELSGSMLIRDPATGNRVRTPFVKITGNPKTITAITVVGGGNTTLNNTHIVDATNNVVATFLVRGGTPTVVTNPATGVSYNLYTINIGSGERIAMNGATISGNPGANGYYDFTFPTGNQSVYAVGRNK
jgi:hypothetical protein